MGTPAVGEVIPYWYLWRRELEAGEDAGRKLRPCAVVAVIVSSTDQGDRVAVLPITRSAPQAGQRAIAVPAGVKRQLGLDESPSWIVCDEFNDLIWPGFDIGSTLSGAGSYGRPPKNLLMKVRTEFLDAVRTGAAKPVQRT